MSTPPDDPAELAPPGARVLLVDDQPDILELLGLLLQAEGFVVVTAADGEAALVEARLAPFDAFVLDVSMPKMDGIELASALQAEPKTRDVPVLFHTSLMESEVRERFKAYAGFVRKPVDPGRLIDLLRSTLREHTATSPS